MTGEKIILYLVFFSSFGESVKLLHPFHEQFGDSSGSQILRLCKFQQRKTKIAQVFSGSQYLFACILKLGHGEMAQQLEGLVRGPWFNSQQLHVGLQPFIVGSDSGCKRR